MSIVTVLASDTMARVAVDTRSLFPDGSVRECSKLHVVPHLHVVLACRGSGDVAAGVCDAVRFAASFDDAVNILERELPGIVDDIGQRERTDLPAWASIRGQAQEITIVGWSPLAKRVVVVRLQKLPQQDLRMDETRGLYAHPLTEDFKHDFPSGWAPQDADDFMRLARAQVACGRAVAGHTQGWGGRLVVGEVTKDGVSIHCLGEI